MSSPNVLGLTPLATLQLAFHLTIILIIKDGPLALVILVGIVYFLHGI